MNTEGWRPKRTAIEEAKDLKTSSTDNLICSLISYEEDLAAERGDKDKKKKSIALKASKPKSDEERDFEDENMAMMASERRKFRNFKNQKEKKEVIICYGTLLNKLKNKAMVAT